MKERIKNKERVNVFFGHRIYCRGKMGNWDTKLDWVRCDTRID